MVDNTRQNPDMRDQFKCSECRRKKIKVRDTDTYVRLSLALSF